MPSSHSPTNRPDLIGPVLQSTHVIEKLAVPCGPADLHDARSDHCDFVVPHPSIHTEGATHAFKRGGITASLAKTKGRESPPSVPDDHESNGQLGRLIGFVLVTASAGLLFPSLCTLSERRAKMDEAHSIL